MSISIVSFLVPNWLIKEHDFEKFSWSAKQLFKEKTMLENYLRRRLNLPDVGEEMDDGSLDNQLQAISNLLSGTLHCSLFC